MVTPSDMTPAVRDLVEDAVGVGTVPGLVLLAARDGNVCFQEAFGVRQRIPNPLSADISTVYDIASVTKAVCTSVLAMKAVAMGRLNLDIEAHTYLPEFRGASKELVTVRHLLAHASGLPAHRPYYENVSLAERSASAIMNAAAGEALIAPPGTRSVYSDLGFILLGWLLERVLDQEIDHLFREHVVQPLELRTTRFVRRDGGAEVERAALLANFEVAPTALSPMRQGLVHGEVDDLNAFAMGGVAGHAGLFSDARDLSRLANALVQSWQAGALGNELVPPEVIREFWRPAGIVDSNWRLGWDGPSASDSQAGSKLSRAAVGHLGFTGCSLWIDPAQALWIIMLTNRVHPTARPDPRFRRLRADLHDALLDLLGS